MTDEQQPIYIVVERPAPKRRIPRWTWLALAALVMGGAGIGTFASFTASTSNNATFATGTLVMNNTVNSGTVCLSAVGGTTDVNDNPSCSQLFNLQVAKPGDSATSNLDIEHDGSIDASALSTFAAAACAPGDVATENFHGTGNPCGEVELTIQEFDTPLKRTNLDASGTNGRCWYGGNAGANNLCSFDDTITLTTFATTYPSFGSALGMGAMNDQTTRYFQIGVKLDPNAGNDVQGRSASLGIRWRLVQ